MPLFERFVRTRGLGARSDGVTATVRIAQTLLKQREEETKSGYWRSQLDSSLFVDLLILRPRSAPAGASSSTVVGFLYPCPHWINAAGKLLIELVYPFLAKLRAPLLIFRRKFVSALALVYIGDWRGLGSGLPFTG